MSHIYIYIYAAALNAVQPERFSTKWPFLQLLYVLRLEQSRGATWQPQACSVTQHPDDEIRRRNGESRNSQNI